MPENFAEQHRNIEFTNSVSALLMQQPGVLYPFCGSSDNYSGNVKARIRNYFGEVVMEERTTRNPDTPSTDITSIARFIKPGKTHDVALLVDPDDEEVTEVDLASPLTAAVARAAARYHDDRYIAGFFGDGYQGEGGDTAVPFKSTNIIAHGGVGITLNKLQTLEQLMRERNVDFEMERPTILLTPADKRALDQIEEYKNTRYQPNMPMATGNVYSFGVFDFIVFNPSAQSLPKTYTNILNAGGYRNLPVMLRSGMHRGIWNEFQGRLSERPDKSYAEQTYGKARSACVRTDEDRAFILQTQ